MFEISNSEAAFRGFLGQPLENVPIRKAFHTFLDFYEQVKPTGLALSDAMGDAILFQWGSYDWGKGLFFEINITRQFLTSPGNGDDDLSQLLFTYRYLPSGRTKQLGEGNSWYFPEPMEDTFQGAFAEYRVMVTDSAQVTAMQSTKPIEIELYWTLT